MYRICALSGVSVVALQIAFLAAPDLARAQSSDKQLPPVTIQAPDQTRRVAAPAAGKRSGARRASAKPAPAESPRAVAQPANALGTYNPALDLPGLKLPPGTTVTTAGPVDGYRALSAFSATKTATPIEQVPQITMEMSSSLSRSSFPTDTRSPVGLRPTWAVGRFFEISTSAGRLSCAPEMPLKQRTP